MDLVEAYFGEAVPTSAMCVPTENRYCAAAAIMRHFDNLDMIYSDYKESTENLHNYMKRQWNFVGGMADAFKEMQL